MRIDIITLFPETFGPLFSSIPARAQDKGKLELHLHWLREFGLGPHHQVDDTPFGGGPGMVMKCEPIVECLDAIGCEETRTVIFPTPQGVPFKQKHALELSEREHLVFICGHYEGVDQRVRDHWVDLEYSLGDYVLSNGELAAMVISDAVIRLIPGVIKPESYQQDSFFKGGLDHPHYTKPAEFRGYTVPEVLLSGHHKKIEEWRLKMAAEKTLRVRPELCTTRTAEKAQLALSVTLLRSLLGVVDLYIDIGEGRDTRKYFDFAFEDPEKTLEQLRLQKEYTTAMMLHGRAGEAVALFEHSSLEGLTFKRKFSSGPQRLYWANLEEFEGGSLKGSVLEAEELCATAPLITMSFGYGRDWFESFDIVALPDFCVALEEDGMYRGACLVGGHSSPCIWAIVVEKSSRRRGLGRALLHHSLQRLKNAGYATVRAHVHPDNEISVKFFEDAGFQFVDSTSTFIQMAQTCGAVCRRDFKCLGLDAMKVERACRRDGIEVFG